MGGTKQNAIRELYEYSQSLGLPFTEEQIGEKLDTVRLVLRFTGVPSRDIKGRMRALLEDIASGVVEQATSDVDDTEAIAGDDVLNLPTVEIPCRGTIEQCQFVLSQRLNGDPGFVRVDIHSSQQLLVVRLNRDAPYPPKQMILRVGNFPVAYWGESPSEER